LPAILNHSIILNFQEKCFSDKNLIKVQRNKNKNHVKHLFLLQLSIRGFFMGLSAVFQKLSYTLGLEGIWEKSHPGCLQIQKS
jgi:hypothetical protein